LKAKNELTDTIVAIATAQGRGGIGIVRLSGPQAFAIAKQVFSPSNLAIVNPWPSHQMFYGMIGDVREQTELDEGLVVRMEDSHSYTGEEVVEIQGHGSPVVLQQTVGICVSKGARLAAPGEFTRRAYLNGKVDLVQAEAIAELIHAESEAEAWAAKKRLQGKLSQGLEELRANTISLLAECEADIDFPEENLPLASRPHLLSKIKQNQLLTEKLLKSFENNQRLHQGFSVVFIGRPNVGKSSIFNALLDIQRAIVTPIAGTTRDVIREELILQGRRVRLIDTAGLRSSALDMVEKLGMERTEDEMIQADIVCLVCSTLEELTKREKEILKKDQLSRVWLLWNKIDLKAPSQRLQNETPVYEVSALRGDGITKLRDALGATCVEKSMVRHDGGIANDRQKNLLDQYLKALTKGRAEWEKNSSPEFVAFELRLAHQCISQILGKDDTMEEVLDEIFSRFCVGK